MPKIIFVFCEKLQFRAKVNKAERPLHDRFIFLFGNR